jgi:hypothetical protein
MKKISLFSRDISGVLLGEDGVLDPLLTQFKCNPIDA